jgi:uncharacterized damage-inducible protein DinB
MPRQPQAGSDAACHPHQAGVSPRYHVSCMQRATLADSLRDYHGGVVNIRDMLTLYDYNYWATRRILAASMHVSPEQFLIPTTQNFGSLRGTLVHTLDAECAWRMLWQHQTLAYFGALEEAAFPTIAVVEQRWHAEERAMRDYLAHRTDADLTDYVRYTTPEGDKRERVLWHCLLHVVNHGTQHRSEAAAILTEYGHSPGGLDFTLFLNEQQ